MSEDPLFDSTESTSIDSSLLEQTPSPVTADSARRAAADIQREIAKAIVGQRELTDLLTLTLFASGHILVEGVPGTAKTLAVRAFAAICGANFNRIQFTPDLMPSDILGTSIFGLQTEEFRLKKGPIFSGMVLADEINRTPPKTQSALLEAMEERQVTIDGVSHPLPDPFLVCATQNPIEFEGAYPLPEAQLDRFMFKAVVDYPTEAEERFILERYQTGFRSSDLETAHLQSVMTHERLVAIRQEIEAVRVEPPVRAYIVQVVRALRANRHVTLGPSPRAAVILMLASKALAAIAGRSFVTPDDVKMLATPVFRHRIMLQTDSEIEGHTAEKVLVTSLASVEVPR